LLVAGCKKNDTGPAKTHVPLPQDTIYKAPADFRVVGYLLSGDIDAGMANSFNTSRVNYLNIPFSDTTGDGTVPNTNNLVALISSAHSNNTKVLISVGNDFIAKDFYADESARSKFITNLMASVDKFQFDGVDVDLEGDYINTNYEVFMQELSAAVHLKGKVMTAAVATWETDYFTNKSLTYFDYLNVMSYDDTGPWDPSDPGPHSPYSMAVADLDFWTNTRGIAKEKLNLGVPFYGYGFKGPSVSTLTYAQIIARFSGSQNTDKLTEPNGAILYYNGIPTIKKKTTYAMQNAGGVMIWELMYDTNDKTSLLSAIDQTANPGNN
jgi:chitinase